MAYFAVASLSSSSSSSVASLQSSFERVSSSQVGRPKLRLTAEHVDYLLPPPSSLITLFPPNAPMKSDQASISSTDDLTAQRVRSISSGIGTFKYRRVDG
ncbi:hypothetical protein GE21DRAFT_1222276 [Neurospora crassa]|nr:related to cell division protein ftsz [imported] - Neurospora crassa [Neurospora crassa]KHE78871.1 hypothetical protein GE21DRAFT_1222276 [Neurospora crassa]